MTGVGSAGPGVVVEGGGTAGNSSTAVNELSNRSASSEGAETVAYLQ